MSKELEREFNEAMLNIYQRAKIEAKYNASIFLQMVTDHGGLETARRLINASTVSSGYIALWERNRLDLTVEAMLLNTSRYQALFTADELEICKTRLRQYGYKS